ncbi:hypothetical protein MNB_SV-15-1277 [hydrothermal vent metagenome]|uniref:Formylmethanofuran dehydrogenase subunit E domain-containing protein n=1 Tax=hydrothermal vent metagenome TaxID=652676 RepID=A0A1W1EKC2_9ZZZZ
MNYPKFFDEVESIVLQDKLSSFLGTFDGGEVEFSYLDVVKQAGHSCPTVAGAYLMVLEGLKALYPDEIAQRGEIEVEFKESLEDGVAGVIANVVTHITGATQKSGFKGIGGNFARHSLMKFDAPINSSMRLTRKDNGKSVEIIYDPSSVAPNPQMGMLMNKIMGGEASMEDRVAFGKFWQERVEKIFNSISEVITIK